jgi:alpha-amylase
VELAWNPPDVEEGVAGYRVYQEGITEQVAEASAKLRSCTISGLKGAMAYTFMVSTLNEDGDESERIAVEATTHAPGKPGPPTFLQATSHGTDHIALSWAPPRDIGGASVTAYHVFRDGQAVDCIVSRDPETGEDYNVLNWRDSKVEAGKAYKYTASAMHLPDRTPSQSELLDLLERKASKSLMEVSPEDNEGPCCEEIQVSAVVPLKMPKMGERVTRVMLQGFNWWSCDNKKGWYNILNSKVPEFEEAGFNMIWLPPPCRSADKRGYLPSEWYTLDSKYGTKEELCALGQILCSAGICPILDVVVNHRCASKKDDKGRWTVFEKPAWGPWAVCRNDQSGFGEGAESTGELIAYAPDIDHTNPQVQRDVKDWIKWMMSEVGIRALRLDFVIGFAPRIQEQYVRGGDSPFAVAEYWHGDVDVLRNYINATKGAVAVFDFPVYYTLKHCVRSNDFGGLRCDGRPPGIMGLDPARCCSFVENHDTDHLEIVGGPFGDSAQIVRGYVYILTHPGTPCVFWSDWADRGQDVRRQINCCVQLRHQAEIHCLSRCSIDKAEGGLYAAYIDGMKGGLAVKLGNRDWSPNGNWKIATYGTDYCVWRRD